ncbi:MAG: tetratricopeptide repeat protein [Chitinophagales bacterium]|nr:tetratricopeptide repeat protein [Chitinophagales bacterium]
MRIQQIILLLTGAALVAVLYVFGITKAPKKPEAAMPGAMEAMASSGSSTIDFQSILDKAMTTLPEKLRDSVAMAALSLEKVRGETEKVKALQSLGDDWTKTGNIIVAGRYYADAAAINNDIKLWEAAADRFFMGFPTAADSLVRMYAVQEAIRCYDQLRKLDSSNMTYPVREAICYVDGQGQIMQGVTLLKAVEKKDPDNKDMNLILGRLSVVSGQYDKAVARLEHLVKTDPGNAEAYFHLAEAYRALGRKEDAIKALETCKSLVKDDDFRAQIDSYINQIKN